MTEVLAYIGLGSNQDNPESQLRAAIEALFTLPQTHLQACSSLYRSAPMGPQDQPDYVNAVVRLRTALAGRLGLPVWCWDERLSSVAAEAALAAYERLA